MNNLNRVVISGLGVVSPYGLGRKLFWEQLHKGVSASKWISSFDTSGMPTKFWANNPMSDLELTTHLVKKKMSKLFPSVRINLPNHTVSFDTVYTHY